MSGHTSITRISTGEDTNFECLAIGHFFKEVCCKIDSSTHYSFFVSIKTDQETAFNLAVQKAHRIKKGTPVIRVHEFDAYQTITDA